jgi:hypothetical protein
MNVIDDVLNCKYQYSSDPGFYSTNPVFYVNDEGKVEYVTDSFSIRKMSELTGIPSKNISDDVILKDVSIEVLKKLVGGSYETKKEYLAAASVHQRDILAQLAMWHADAEKITENIIGWFNTDPCVVETKPESKTTKKK